MWIGGTGINEGQKKIKSDHPWAGSIGVLNSPIGVLNGPIVLNTHIGPNSPPMAGIWAFEWRPLCGPPFEPSVYFGSMGSLMDSYS